MWIDSKILSEKSKKQKNVYSVLPFVQEVELGIYMNKCYLSTFSLSMCGEKVERIWSKTSLTIVFHIVLTCETLILYVFKKWTQCGSSHL
jgi:hypothetical protein